MFGKGGQQGRIKANERGAAGWHDIIIGIGVLFLLLAAVIFGVDILGSTGLVGVSSSGNEDLLFASGVFGLIALAGGFWLREHS